MGLHSSLLTQNPLTLFWRLKHKLLKCKGGSEPYGCPRLCQRACDSSGIRSRQRQLVWPDLRAVSQPLPLQHVTNWTFMVNFTHISFKQNGVKFVGKLRTEHTNCTVPSAGSAQSSEHIGWLLPRGSSVCDCCRVMVMGRVPVLFRSFGATLLV